MTTTTAEPVAVPQAEKTLNKCSPAMLRNSPIAFLICVILIPIAGLGLALLIIWWLTCKNTTLTITNKRVTLTNGILSKKTNEVRHKDVRNIQVKQSFFQRLMGVGTIDISSAGQSDVEISVSGIRKPQKIAKIIREYQA